MALSDAEIASVLVVARSTVRKHLENIYEKLGVQSRTAALARLRNIDGRTTELVASRLPA